ncbi:MAG: DJ-1/PfpI family protein [Oscillospiraceae bacterium]|nr:DJ-1/PfpI family protein [Oscillospiraceae bacterium]
MVYLLLENGFEMCEALVPVDVLRRGGVDVVTVGVSDMSVTSSHGVVVTADKAFSDISVSDMEMLIIPGGQPGVDNLWENDSVKELVRKVYGAGINMAAICAAPIISARLGILDGKKCVCYPSCREELKDAQFCDGVGVIKDGNIITGRAAGDAYDFAFAILEALCGAEEVNKVKSAVCYE